MFTSLFRLAAMFGDSLEEEVTFLSLKSRIIDLLLQALLTESDSANTQMLLGKLVGLAGAL